jgi:hypothetical protein
MALPDTAESLARAVKISPRCVMRAHEVIKRPYRAETHHLSQPLVLQKAKKESASVDCARQDQHGQADHALEGDRWPGDGRGPEGREGHDCAFSSANRTTVSESQVAP